MNDIKNILNFINSVESKKNLTESVEECGDMGAMSSSMPAPAPENPGNPVTASVTLNASGMDHVADLMRLLQQAGLEQAGPVAAPIPPMRNDMENLRDKMAGLEGPPSEPKPQYFGVDDVTGSGDDMHQKKNPADIRVKDSSAYKGIDEWDRDPDMEREERDEGLEGAISMAVPQYKFTPVDHETAMKIAKKTAKMSSSGSYMDADTSDEFYDYLERRGLVKESDVSEWTNEPDEEYGDHIDMIKTLSGGINKEKKMYKPAAKGDNPMATESIKDRLYRALSEKKAKPDFLDLDGDGDTKEPMKKALKDKKKKTSESAVSEISPDLAKRYTKRAKMDRDFNDDDLERLPNKVRHGTDDQARQASADMARLQRRNSKRQTGINRAAKRM